MNKIVKTAIAMVVSSGLILSAAAPVTASARQTYVCQVEKKQSAQTGMILGAVVGGLLGSQVSKNEKGLGAVGGAVIGGVVGNKLGKDHGKSNCNKIEEQARESYGYDRYDRNDHRRSSDRRYDNRYDRGYGYGYR